MANMKKPFDIFGMVKAGRLGLRQLKRLRQKTRIERLPHANSGSYSVIDQRTGNRLAFAQKLQASSSSFSAKFAFLMA
jgi:hypothetical protein